MKYLKQFLKEKKRKVQLVLLLLLGQSVGTLLIPFLIAGIVDQGILKGDMDAIMTIGIQMLIVALVTTAVSVWGSFVSADIGALLGRDMREKLLIKSQTLSVQQFNAIGVSSMITRATSDIANLQQTTGLLLQLAVPAPIIAGASVVMTAMINVPMAILQIVFMLLLVAFSIIMLKKSNTLSYGIQVRLDKINKVVRESITGVRVIRAFANEAYEEKRAEQAYGDYAENMIRLNRLFAVFNPIVWILMGLLMACIVALGGGLVLQGGMAIGEITAVAEYAIITLGYLVMAATTMTMLPKTKACIERLEEVFDTIPAILDSEKEGYKMESIYENGKEALVFDKVTFAYPDAEEPVIYDLSFQCRKGETTAIIGSTGSGKSTMADLLLRIHDIKEGQIKVGGTNIKELSQNALRNKVACVPQKAFLFSGTIADNLRMGKEDATEEEMWQALKTAQADTFVESLPKKLNAPVAQGGTNFSGGQKQRLSIARALIKNADVFVFDDSFSALDVKTDAALRKALQTNITAPAKLIIAQRVSTILDANQILVLEEGRLVGVGTHEELMNNCEIYRAIAESQMNKAV